MLKCCRCLGRTKRICTDGETVNLSIPYGLSVLKYTDKDECWCAKLLHVERD